MQRTSFIAAGGLAAILSTAIASAQTGFDANQLHLAPDPDSNYLSAQSGKTLHAHGWSAGLAYNFAENPVVLEDPSTLTPVYAPPYTGGVVTSQGLVHVLGAYGVTEWLQVGLDIPFVVNQSGDNLTGLASPQPVDDAPGFGDIRLVPKVQFFETDATEEESQFSAAAIVDWALPIGDRERYQGGGVRLEPTLAAEWRSAVGFRVAGNLGLAWRADHATVADAVVDNGPTWAVAAEFVVLADRLSVLAEAHGDLGRELLLGAKGVAFDSTLYVAAGPGLPSGDTLTPDWRLVVGWSYSGGEKPPSDVDRDGLIDQEDRCPHDPEDDDGFQDDDGCPDPDNDEDGVPDVKDECPLSPEDIDRFQDEDGCPDEDNDEDGIVDLKDACVRDAEDADGYQDGDGCPDPDNDEDGIPDVADKCPTDPEDADGDQDEDGCPDFAPVVRIDLVVFFDTNSAQLTNTVQIALGKVAHTLIAMPDDLHVWIEGHADDRGEAEANEELALERAAAVRQFLREQGVPGERMTVHSYGDTKELRIGKNTPDRQVNRRVEFRVGPKSFVKSGSKHESEEER